MRMAESRCNAEVSMWEDLKYSGPLYNSARVKDELRRIREDMRGGKRQIRWRVLRRVVNGRSERCKMVSILETEKE
jgi:hypothetical protein